MRESPGDSGLGALTAGALGLIPGWGTQVP